MLSDAQISALVAERHPCSLTLQCFNDNFDDNSLGDDWAVASRGATSFTPTVSSKRMRLTSNQGNVSTSSTLQRLFPAAGNYIQVQFKYYAYSGSGADGVAVVLSDATVTPQPGAFGGPLGYGTRGDAANPGFAGGWLGWGSMNTAISPSRVATIRSNNAQTRWPCAAPVALVEPRGIVISPELRPTSIRVSTAQRALRQPRTHLSHHRGWPLQQRGAGHRGA